jgi:hypothetical protein
MWKTKRMSYLMGYNKRIISPISSSLVFNVRADGLAAPVSNK